MAIQRLTENTVREAPATTARLRPANFDAAEIRARALQGFGQQLGQVAEVVDEIGYKYDLAEAKKADAEDAIELARIRAEAMSAVGVDAPKAAEEARKAAEQLRKTRLSSLKGRRGELYANSFNQRMASFEGQLTEHSIKQADAAERGAAAGRAETSLTLAIDGYSDPQVWQDNIVTAEKEFRAANRGKAEDQLAREWSEARSKAHVSVVKSIMANDPDGVLDADKWIEDHAAEIDPVHEPELRKSLQPLLNDQLADADFQRAMAAASGVADAALPDDGQDDASAPTPAVPRAEGEAPKNLTQHLVAGKGRVTSTATAHRARGSGNALDIAAPAGTAIRPPMSGRVVKSWLDTEHGGGWSLLVEHPNGMVTGYAHMKSRAPVDVGDEVDSTTVIGSVGSTGRSTGNHLHFTVRDAKGVKVDPQGIDWAAVAGSGGPKTVDPTKVKWKEGELPRYIADKNMLNSAMEAVYRQATKENWSKRRYDAAITKAREFAGVSEQLFNAQYDDLRDRVWEKIASLDGGDSLTNISQLGTDYGLLRGQDKLTVSNLIQANKKRAEEGTSIKANGDEYVDWRLMAGGSATERQMFLQQDFRANPNMTAAERARLSIMQQDLRKDENGTLAADIDRVRATVNRYAPEAGFDVERANKGQNTQQKEDRRRRTILIDRTTNLINRRQKELGRPLNDIEIDGIVRSQVVAITRDGETRPLYLDRVTPQDQKKGPATLNVDRVYESIPTAVRDQITRSLQRRGQPVTPQRIIEIYLEGSR
jgi:murein DD-endopeptidase MepM/ murein hydrolase activator NlpD